MASGRRSSILNQRYSALIGIIGGLVDLVAGVAVIQSAMMLESSLMMHAASTEWVGYFLILLGAAVLSTGLYLLTPRMMNQRVIGPLMLVYGAVMWVLGIGMLTGMLSMMQNSTLSGAAMLLTGTAMLYSGYSMKKVS